MWRWQRRAATTAILMSVGFNPYQKFKASPADYALVVAAAVVVLALLVWAVLG